jgi:hypothetical protein
MGGGTGLLNVRAPGITTVAAAVTVSLKEAPSAASLVVDIAILSVSGWDKCTP